MKRIAIVGVGAIGSILGGYLTKGGEDVTLICSSWREHAEAIKKHGLKIRGAKSEQLIKVKALFIDELSQLKEKIEILFIAVKSNDTQKVLTMIKPYLAKDAWVLSAQNGINEDVIIPIVGKTNTIGCSVRTGGTLREPGVVMEGGTEGVGFIVGELDGQITPRVKEIARILSLCRRTEIITDIWLERWNKLVTVSMSSALSVVTGLGTGQLFASDKAHRVFAWTLLEAVQVAAALGYRIESVARIGMDVWKKLAQGPLPEVDKQLSELGRMFGDAPSGATLDLMKGRSTEIDYINGYIVKRGKEVSVPTPVNKMLVGMVKAIESGKAKPGPDKLDEVLKSMV